MITQNRSLLTAHRGCVSALRRVAVMISAGLPELVGDWSAGLSRKVAGLAPAQVNRLGLQSLVRAALALTQLHRELWEGTRAALAEGGCEAGELAEHCRFLLRMAEAN